MTDLRAIFARLSLFDDGSLLAKLQVKPSWIEQIKGKQFEDESLGLRVRQIEGGSTTNFGLNSDRAILREAHNRPYAMYPGENKMYRDLREIYWWPGLKREDTNFVDRCLTCQLVKAEHQLPLGLLQPALGSRLDFSTAFSPETDGQSKRMIHILEDMLRHFRSDPTHIVPVEEIEVRPDLTFEEKPVHLLDRDVKVLRRKFIPLVKVLWRSYSTEEAMWELEDAMCQRCPHFFD
ncbi:uncharacterized protein LOC128041736 [Gossypium raimondii]|uniref:uncharacterized protein LOC128041736 n=1 Tax=Gossypium raimondii TaxID=29730 RepID=UPI00227B863E|nr:uncharacterized protein LOC128041736 [Gossypium raimondii]